MTDTKKGEGCQCFSCKNKDNKDRLYGYYTGLYEAYKATYEDMVAAGIRMGSISDNSIEGALARTKWNMESTGCLLDEVESKVLERARYESYYDELNTCTK